MRLRKAPAAALLALTILPASGCGFIAPADTSIDINEDDVRIALLAPSADQELTAFSFSQTAPGSTALLTVLIKNFGELDAEALTATVVNADGSTSPYAFAGGTYPGSSGALSGTCSDTLESDSTCTLILEFAPVTAGTFTGSLTLSYFNGLSTVDGELELTGIASP